MGKGSGRRPQNITDAQLEEAWNSIFSGHPTEEQFDKVKKDIVKRKEEVIKEDGYGNEIPKTNDPDRFVDDLGDS
jgi:hypothetical protein